MIVFQVLRPILQRAPFAMSLLARCKIVGSRDGPNLAKKLCLVAPTEESMDASWGHEACRTAFPKDCDRTQPATRREVIVTQPDAKSSFFALVPKVLNSSLETLERYMTRHGIAGRLE